jgi:hypothetical protein
VACAQAPADLASAWRLWVTGADLGGARPRGGQRTPTALRWVLGPRVLATAHLLRATIEPRFAGR